MGYEKQKLLNTELLKLISEKETNKQTRNKQTKNKNKTKKKQTNKKNGQAIQEIPFRTCVRARARARALRHI